VRMTWWAIRILRQNDFTPDEVRWRKMIDNLKDRLPRAGSEAILIKLVHEINELVRKLNTMGTNVLKCDIAPVCLETELVEFRERTVRNADPT